MKKITTVAVYLLAGLLIAAMMLSAVSCELFDQGADAPAPSLTETRTAVSTTRSKGMVIYDPPLWPSLVSTPYAIVRITEKTDETVVEHYKNSVDVEYRIYKIQVIFTISDQVASWNRNTPVDTVWINIENDDLRPGDILLTRLRDPYVLNQTYAYIWYDEEYQSEYVVIPDEGTINADETLKIDAFWEFDEFNEVIDEDKRFQGEMTLDDVIDFFTALDTAYDNWLVKWRELTS